MADLRLHQVVKRYGAVQIIHGIDLEIEHGAFVVFVGPSGCGKSTLLRMIAGLEEITDGEILIDGELVNEIDAAKRGLAMVFQSYALYPHMTVRKNLSFGLETLRMPKDIIRQRISEVAQILKIEELLDRRPAQLSGGQRQRVAIGRAIVREPRIFLFDEPLSNLDAELRVQMRVEIARLHQRIDATMIYVTHDQVEAMTMADQIVVLNAGRIEQTGTPLDLYNLPANLFVAGFIGSPKMNFFTLRHQHGELMLDSGVNLPLTLEPMPPEDSLITLGIRPEHLHLGESEAGGTSLLMTVTLTEQLGGETLVYGALGSGETLTLKAIGQIFIEPGQKVPVRVDLERCHLFDQSGKRLAAAPRPTMDHAPLQPSATRSSSGVGKLG